MQSEKNALMKSGLRSIFLALLFSLLACVPKSSQEPRRYLQISVEKQATFIRNFNPLLASGARDFTVGAIYEPLFIFNRLKGEFVPWLSTHYEWLGSDYKTLRMDIRQGVKWSDGKELTAGDVAFTFQLLKKFPAFDMNAVWNFLDEVKVSGPAQVTFTMKRSYVPGFANIAGQPIVPEHIWKSIDNPVTFANSEPVGTGPFTEVKLFRDQVFELARNPHYWQAGKPYIEGLRFPAYASNDQANLALIKGDVDLAGNFVPAVERIYSKKDPAHNHFWSPLVGPMIFLYLNTQKAPFDRPEVRKAISMAINRPMIVEVAMYKYTNVAHPSGLTDAFKNWRTDPDPAEAAWLNYNPSAAKAALEKAGYKADQDGWLRDAKGETFSIELTVVNGWSDWVRAAQIIATNLQAIGIDAKVKSKDFGAWFEGLQKGSFQAGISWSGEGVDPYPFYRQLMSEDTLLPLDTPAPANWHRYSNAKATQLLRAFEKTADPEAQKQIMRELQAIFIHEAPALPLFPAPAWGEFHTRFFDGFPSADNPYAMLSPNFRPEILLMLTEIRPVARGG